jgi:hypothetical protein
VKEIELNKSIEDRNLLKFSLKSYFALLTLAETFKLTIKVKIEI